jgi:hypothetical protein
MERRTALRVIGAAALAGAHTGLAPLADAATCANHAAIAAQVRAAAPYQLQFFTPDENGLVDQLSELVIPTDDHSPGAHAAQVSYFADLMLATSAAPVKEQWRNGLRLIREQLGHEKLETILAHLAAHEDAPITELDLFFVTLKEMTVSGYYTSSIGIHQDLQYQGNTYLDEFQGCTHPEHQ